MTRGAGKYPEEVSVPMTAQMYQFVELLAKRERGSKQMQHEFLQQHLHTSALQLAAIILLQMKQGTQGSDVLEQIAQLAAHAGDELKAVLEVKA